VRSRGYWKKQRRRGGLVCQELSLRWVQFHDSSRKRRFVEGCGDEEADG
jgi:hypothetical protein